jgi:hypothetical protein
MLHGEEDVESWLVDEIEDELRRTRSSSVLQVFPWSAWTASRGRILSSATKPFWAQNDSLQLLIIQMRVASLVRRFFTEIRKYKIYNWFAFRKARSLYIPHGPFYGASLAIKHGGITARGHGQNIAGRHIGTFSAAVLYNLSCNGYITSLQTISFLSSKTLSLELCHICDLCFVALMTMTRVRGSLLP